MIFISGETAVMGSTIEMVDDDRW
uniref:Uncharacterized protein n=1 Tax=mine drainage metagenome TaxID=410659 RepID=E6QXH6_9ZZZZ